MRFNNIQILRVVAAVAVVVSHLIHYGEHLFRVRFPVGFLRDGTWTVFPVPLFFAVSGFVLTHAVRAAPPGRFLFARFLRLYPGYWVAAAVTMGLMWFTVWPEEYRRGVTPYWVGWTLRPRAFGSCIYVLGIEWSLVYEVVLSLAVAVFGLLGARRGLPAAAGVWLAVLVVKVVVWPGYAAESLPTWGTVFLSAFNMPFLLGVLTYSVRDHGRRWRWAAFAGLVAFLAVVPGRLTTLEEQWCAYGFASAVVVWFAVQVRQVAEKNPLARLGDCTYGLYLVHVPVIMGVFYLLLGRGWLLGSSAGVLLAGAAALVVGLLYGRFECRLHGKLRPLVKMKIGDVRAWAGRARAGALRPAARQRTPR
ncbi:MAG: acyltransferase 3 [Gemmataceae bacterium]|nr:acyltransferase 3 [Gemmataceae bacterium]